SGLGHEGGPDAPAGLGAHRDVLEVGVGGGEAAGGGPRRVVGGVHPPVGGIDQRRQRIHVRALELRQLPVLEDLPRDGMLLRQDRQGGGVGRVHAALGGGALGGQSQLVEEHVAELR